MTILVLVRHGQASFGARNYDELSALGARQSTVLGQHWARLAQTFDAAYSGDMSRQRATATHALAAAGLNALRVEERPAFNEYDFESIMRAYFPVVAREHPELAHSPQQLMTDRKLFQAVYEKAIAYWLREHPHEHHPFESWLAFCARAVTGLKDIATRERKAVAVFTSGGVIAAALREALGVDDLNTFRLNWRIYNASVHVLRMGRDGFSLMGFNNVSHLEMAGDPALLTFR